MTGRKTVIGMALVCALALCALAASNAAASGTTAFTCAENGGEKDFSDAHCDKQVKAGEGKFGHVSIAVGTTQEITVSNEKTASETTAAEPTVLTGTLAGIAVEVVCNSVTGTGTLKNEEVAGAMQAAGNVTMEHSKCTVAKPPTCSVAEPIVYKNHFKTYQNGTEMGVEYKPENEVEFGSFVLKNNGAQTCLCKGTYKIEGSYEGTAAGSPTGKGATQVFTKEMGKLTWAGHAYTLTGAVTMRLKGGNPIAFTT